jgi:hypothetical protein
MDLPKNITQIGESDRNCKVYAEDYVVSYMKQLNRVAYEKELALALYGERKEEEGIAYLFCYGAAKLHFLQRECRHLSQAQHQEIERLRRRYFPQYVFLGYRLLNGEMIEGFHVCEGETCRYITGYAQFYAKNDSMLAYMLEERGEEARPEMVDMERYEVVRKRQEERRDREETYSTMKKAESERIFHRSKMAIAAAFALICLAGVLAMGKGGAWRDLQTLASRMIAKLSEKQLPDAIQTGGDSAVIGSLVASDNLSDALQGEGNDTAAPAPSMGPTQEPGIEPTLAPAAEPTSVPTLAPTVAPTPIPTSVPTPGPATPPPQPLPMYYTVKRGDTLIGICTMTYGNDKMVAEVCAINGIKNPDAIKIGEKILLP